MFRLLKKEIISSTLFSHIYNIIISENVGWMKIKLKLRKREGVKTLHFDSQKFEPEFLQNLHTKCFVFVFHSLVDVVFCFVLF